LEETDPKTFLNKLRRTEEKYLKAATIQVFSVLVGTFFCANPTNINEAWCFAVVIRSLPPRPIPT